MTATAKASERAAAESAATAARTRRGGAGNHLRSHRRGGRAQRSAYYRQLDISSERVSRPARRLERHRAELVFPDIRNSQNLSVGEYVIVELRVFLKHFFKLSLFRKLNEFLETDYFVKLICVVLGAAYNYNRQRDYRTAYNAQRNFCADADNA